MIKKTLTAVGIAALTGAGALSVLPDAQAASMSPTTEIIELASCNPCAAKKKACGACNPCAAKKKACGACNPCAAKKKACNPCNPCAAKKTN